MVPVILPAPEEVVLHPLCGFFRWACAGVVVNMPPLLQMPVDHLRKVRSVRAVAAHPRFLVHGFADVVPLDVATARGAGSDLVARGTFVIQACPVPLVLVGQKPRPRPSHY